MGECLVWCKMPVRAVVRGCAKAKLRRLLIAIPFISSAHPQTFTHFSMTTAPSTSTSHSNFVPIFNAALESYKHKTKKDLASHPLLSSLQSCGSPEAVLTVLRDQIPAFNQSQNRDDGLTKWVIPTVNVLYTFSATVGQGVGLVSIIALLSRREFSDHTFVFRHSRLQMQSLLGSAFSS